MSDENAHAHGHSHEHEPDEEPNPTMGGHGMLVFGGETLYFSHLPMFGPPHNFQVVLEVQLDETAAEALAEDRSADPADIYTFDPDDFPIADLAPADDSGPLTSISGRLVHGHFERAGGRPIASNVMAEVLNVVHFAELDVDAKASADDELAYLAFGRPGHIYLAHLVTARPSFDQVLAARFVPGTVTNQAGSSLDEDIAGRGFEQAQPVRCRRADTPESRLAAGETLTGALLQTVSLSGAHGFRVDIEVEEELYIEVGELA